MHSHIVRNIMIGIVLLLISVAAIADDSAMSDISGGTVQPMKQHPSIRMVSETVDIKLGAKVGWDWPVFVRCEFHLKNEGPATDVTIGFPEEATGGGDGSSINRLKGFKSWVDGEQVKVSYVPSASNPKGQDANDYKAWYVKKVHFDAGQARRITDVYAADLGFTNTAGEATNRLLTYVLRTGANWKGTIGSAVITADLTQCEDLYNIHSSMKHCVAKGKFYTWSSTDFEPAEDFQINLTPILPTIPGGEMGDYQWEPIFKKSGVLMVSPQPMICGYKDVYTIRCVLKANHHTLVVTAGSHSAVLDGKKVRMKTACWIDRDRRAYGVPLVETVQLLGGKVKRDHNGRMNVMLGDK